MREEARGPIQVPDPGRPLVTHADGAQQAQEEPGGAVERCLMGLRRRHAQRAGKEDQELPGEVGDPGTESRENALPAPRGQHALPPAPEGPVHIIRTTNRIERLVGEIRCRIWPMGPFTNARSCERIIFSLITVPRIHGGGYAQHQQERKSPDFLT